MMCDLNILCCSMCKLYDCICPRSFTHVPKRVHLVKRVRHFKDQCNKENPVVPPLYLHVGFGPVFKKSLWECSFSCFQWTSEKRAHKTKVCVQSRNNCKNCFLLFMTSIGPASSFHCQCISNKGFCNVAFVVLDSCLNIVWMSSIR